MTTTNKITNAHLQKTAFVYIRQSSMGQVRHHRESTERQYALQETARSLGWHPDRIKVLDADLGQSGTSTTDRTDFRTLVTDVSLYAKKVSDTFAQTQMPGPTVRGRASSVGTNAEALDDFIRVHS